MPVPSASNFSSEGQKAFKMNAQIRRNEFHHTNSKQLSQDLKLGDANIKSEQWNPGPMPQFLEDLHSSPHSQLSSMKQLSNAKTYGGQ